MKVLFLDDDKMRLAQARTIYSDYEYFEAETAIQAITMLDQKSPFDLVCLDHDLGGKIYCPSDEVSGYHVAKHISEMPEHLRPKEVIVHTYNPVGGKKMMDVLDVKVEILRRIPFGY